jgi:hypothetical protein
VALSLLHKEGLTEAFYIIMFNQGNVYTFCFVC